jgi:hypothetical protein
MPKSHIDVLSGSDFQEKPIEVRRGNAKNRAQEKASAGLLAPRWPFLSFVEIADSG